MSKQFGLIIPGQKKKQPERPRPPTKPSVFDESSSSSDSDNAGGGPPKRLAGKPSVVSGPSLMERRVARNIQEKALAEDPTIFQYDELYDEMDTKREEAKETKRQEPRKAKYIGRLLEHAERRKLENELRIERQVQKDREAEGEMYKDKDTYVTSAYRKKLESIRQLQEQDKRDEYLEAIGDVTKQKDLDGFYRHLYEQKLGTQQEVIKPKTAASAEDVAYKPIKRETTSASKHRTYRRQRSSLDDEDKPEVVDKTTDEAKPATSSTKAHLANNIDADSDFSIDDTSDEEEQVVKATSQKEDAHPKAKSQPSTNDADPKCKPQAESKEQKVNAPEDDAGNGDSSPAVEPEKPVVRTPIDRTLIWRKRTVGEVFDAAVARYHARKLARRA